MYLPYRIISAEDIRADPVVLLGQRVGAEPAADGGVVHPCAGDQRAVERQRPVRRLRVYQRASVHGPAPVRPLRPQLRAVGKIGIFRVGSTKILLTRSQDRLIAITGQEN